MIIDFHTHIFPDKIAEKTIKVLEKNILDIQGKQMYAHLNGTLSDLKRSMKENSIDYSVVMPIATTVTQSNTINNFASSINGHDGIYSFGSIHPMQDNWEEELERIVGLGLHGVKLHPEYQGFYVDSVQAVRVLKKCEKLGLLVTLHTGRDVGIKPPVHCLPEDLRRTVEKLDNGGANVIAAHMGGWLEWESVVKYLTGTEIMLDTSFSMRFMEKAVLEKIFEKHSMDKILFGSDSPWDNQGKSVKDILDLGLNREDCDKILFANAKRLLGL